MDYRDIINCTTHDVTIMDSKGEVVTVIPPSGILPRLSPKTICVGTCQGIRLTKTQYGKSTGMPPEIPGTLYIVSAVLAKGFPQRKDLVIPNELVRNQRTVLGCKSLGFV